jgi:hypothetical protein
MFRTLERLMMYYGDVTETDVSLLRATRILTTNMGHWVIRELSGDPGTQMMVLVFEKR